MKLKDLFIEFTQEQVNAAFDDIICEGAVPEDWMLMHKEGNSLFFKNIISRKYWEVEIQDYMTSSNLY